MAKQVLLLCGLVALVGLCNGQSDVPAKPPTCGRNEEYKCRRSCPPQTCAVLVAKFSCVEEDCKPGCYCKDGYLRSGPGCECLPFKQCPEWKKNPITCGRNEEFKCKNLCPPETCLSLVAFFRCIADQSCEYRCACKNGFLRKQSGSPCIPSQQC